MPFKIKIDKERCIGCGACLFCENFEIPENKSEPKQEVVEDIGCNKEAAEICPVEAISIDEIGYDEAEEYFEKHQ